MTIVSDAKTIRETAISIFRKEAKGRSLDEFMCHPKEMLELCRRVRETLSKKTPDQDICRTLLNARKRGLLK